MTRAAVSRSLLCRYSLLSWRVIPSLQSLVLRNWRLSLSWNRQT
ncbi:unnamed protein product [Timema podura]|uniref:Uncharacterized protein n=1 Tax=Timema podura TaxID=61482 RepID=A0ABN7PGV8_TIMPD|nr:unnamed protein product [Timema podura]